MSDNISDAVNNPVQNVQEQLRIIETAEGNPTPLIPDGRFGTQTLDSVVEFQRKQGLPPSGTVDHATKRAINGVSSDAAEYMSEPKAAELFPGRDTVIPPGGEDDFMFVVQSMLLPLTKRYPSIGTVTVNGVNDEECMNCIINIKIANGETAPDGSVDKDFWNTLSSLYEVAVTTER